MSTIYLDYNATTPLDAEVAQAVRSALTGGLAGLFGNPSSGHEYGRRAHAAIDEARAQLALLLSCEPDEVIFTSGGSEADNLALKGVVEGYADRGNDLVISEIEHPAILNTCRYLEARGCTVSRVPVDRYGRVDPVRVAEVMTDRTVLVSIMHSNNETGTIQPIAEIARVAHARGALMHTDAAQSIGKMPINVRALGVDLLTVAGHKLYAPKGIGALYVRRGVRLEPLIHGAGHESGRRAGTENTPYIVALGKACEVSGRALPECEPRVRMLRDRLHELLARQVPGLELNGHASARLPNTLNVSFPGVDGEELLAATPALAASTGSACHAGRTDPSAVLMAMGLTRERALGAVRLSLGRPTSEAEIERAAEALGASWRALAGARSRT
jgi:cysteine desulfurase